MIHLQSIALAPLGDLPDTFPFTVPVIRALPPLSFTHPITFFVGENGSGKSTLLEAIACLAGLPAVGSSDTDRDETLAPMRDLSRHLRAAWTKRTRKGFFMRSEDFFGYARRIARMQAELAREADDLRRDLHGHSPLAQTLATMPYRREQHALRQSYGAGLDAQSHGESFLKLFRARFVPGGLYLLDEPEAPLSPLRQLALIRLLLDMVAQSAQFIIATHSPLLLLTPGAGILHFADHTVKPAEAETLEHVTITRDFLNQPQAFLRHLTQDDPADL
ncbi:MAG: AAA family ATPase [Anaerolineae bacterium]|jgi:predicted ATPase|nr:AAA family ATPase [Anaerolineae bacterium]